MMDVRDFVKAISSIRLAGVFNPYAENCPTHDHAGSAKTRRENLENYIQTAIRLKVDTVWMGRDLGYRGGRRTGLPLTDEGHLSDFADRFPGSQPAKATASEIVIERTASEIWDKITNVKRAPFLWNVFPFHPHEPDEPMTNRRFRARELSQVHALNVALLAMLNVQRVLAIGRDAQAYAARFDLTIEPVRHPSYGGTGEFRSKMLKLYPETHTTRQRDWLDAFPTTALEA